MRLPACFGLHHQLDIGECRRPRSGLTVLPGRGSTGLSRLSASRPDCELARHFAQGVGVFAQQHGDLRVDGAGGGRQGIGVGGDALGEGGPRGWRRLPRERSRPVRRRSAANSDAASSRGLVSLMILTASVRATRFFCWASSCCAFLSVVRHSAASALELRVTSRQGSPARCARRPNRRC